MRRRQLALALECDARKNGMYVSHLIRREAREIYSPSAARQANTNFLAQLFRRIHIQTARDGRDALADNNPAKRWLL